MLQSPCTSMSRIHVMKSLSRQYKLNFEQLHLTVPTAKLRALHPLFNLQNCKNKNQLFQILAQTISTGFIHNPLTASKLVTTFASSPLPGTTCVALSIADRIEGLDTYTWNTIIRGYLHGDPKGAILVYAHVRRKGLNVDSYTLLYVIKACSLISGEREGGQMHSQILKMGFDSEIITRTALLQMYGLFDEINSAQQVFDESIQRDLVLWSALVAAYAHLDYPSKVFSVSRAMINDNMSPNGLTAASILSACSSLRALREGKLMHCFVVKNFANIDVYVSNALIDMYSKCGCLFNAHLLFQQMPMKNVVSWTSIINGYANNNNPNKALALFKEMESANVPPDEVTMLGVVSMCSKLGSIEFGEWIDRYVEQHGYKGRSICMTNSLMDMYAKCGNIKKASQIFDEMEKKTLVSWTTIIQGLAMHGHGMLALLRFAQMQREGFRPDSVVFLSIISACSHAGLVSEGRECFRSMVEDYKIQPWMEHYGCMVDLLCRAGLVNEAFEFVETMPVNPDAIVWRTLIGACGNQGNVMLASRILDYLLKLEPNYSGNHILLSNLYAMMGQWDHVKEVRMEMDCKRVSKPDPGCSLLEVS